MTLKYKLLYSFIFLGMVPAAIIAFFSLYITSHSIEKQAYNQLTSAREIKKKQLENYFEQTQKDLSLINSVWSNNLKLDSELSPELLAKFKHRFFESFIREYHYYDLFIIDDEGEVFYTVAKESDYQTNLKTGPYNKSGLGTLFQRVSLSRKLEIVDFAPYAPSNDEPASFIAEPIEVNGKFIGVIALQLSIERINQIMQLREGMGETGETYLVGEDHKMRSDSFLDPVGHSVVASFAGSVRHNGVQTQATEAGLRGKSGTDHIIDYNGHPVLSSYSPVDFLGLNWVLVAEIDEAEAFAELKNLQSIIIVITLLTLGIILIATWVISKSILRPIGGEPEEMRLLTEKIAAGDLTTHLAFSSENTGVYASMVSMSQNLTRMITTLSHATTELSSAAEQTSSASVQASASLQEQQASIESVSSAMYEMSETIASVSENARSVADLSKNATATSQLATNSMANTINELHELVEEVGTATEVIAEIESKSQGIGSILDVIRGISEQTNLLALNAAIEAARAGEQGRGFAVVADEVRQLAQKTQLSTRDIEEMIAQLQLDAQNAVTVMKQSRDHTQKTINAAGGSKESIQLAMEEMQSISANAEQIATATVQQSLAAQEISQSITAINDTAAQNAAGSEQVAAASEHIDKLSQQLYSLTAQFKLKS
ncbi:methyl-accepting chemotaxis protein [Shewanella abyssi]|uniref:methyl-accepting chemotaxis protein n=1 Tax=Shewanella abyssi TaxID=311789 RepID=UPI00200DC73A|nr:methyl-accepting chemotaxis protein [Shewanella abyssi]MCL1051207.1 methyl-accepting chemotaxis protein [Shewanella abyssi]